MSLVISWNAIGNAVLPKRFVGVVVDLASNCAQYRMLSHHCTVPVTINNDTTILRLQIIITSL
jgi:cell shape-determining protein MreC